MANLNRQQEQEEVPESPENPRDPGIDTAANQVLPQKLFYGTLVSGVMNKEGVEIGIVDPEQQILCKRLIRDYNSLREDGFCSEAIVDRFSTEFNIDKTGLYNFFEKARLGAIHAKDESGEPKKLEDLMLEININKPSEVKGKLITLYEEALKDPDKYPNPAECAAIWCNVDIKDADRIIALLNYPEKKEIVNKCKDLWIVSSEYRKEQQKQEEEAVKRALDAQKESGLENLEASQTKTDFKRNAAKLVNNNVAGEVIATKPDSGILKIPGGTEEEPIVLGASKEEKGKIGAPVAGASKDKKSPKNLESIVSRLGEGIMNFIRHGTPHYSVEEKTEKKGFWRKYGSRIAVASAIAAGVGYWFYSKSGESDNKSKKPNIVANYNPEVPKSEVPNPEVPKPEVPNPEVKEPSKEPVKVDEPEPVKIEEPKVEPKPEPVKEPEREPIKEPDKYVLWGKRVYTYDPETKKYNDGVRIDEIQDLISKGYARAVDSPELADESREPVQEPEREPIKEPEREPVQEPKQPSELEILVREYDALSGRISGKAGSIERDAYNIMIGEAKTEFEKRYILKTALNYLKVSEEEDKENEKIREQYAGEGKQ